MTAEPGHFMDSQEKRHMRRTEKDEERKNEMVVRNRKQNRSHASLKR